MAGHTKGPWEAIPTDPAEGWDGFRIVGEGKANEWGDIGSVTGPQSNPSCAADARLIAAAPCLLKALKHAINTIEAMRPTFSQVKDEGHAYHDQVLDEALAAIAKAEQSA